MQPCNRFFMLRELRPSSYLAEGRLADVLALIQVLALDEHAHHSKDGLASKLQGPPRSAENWPQVAKRHPEFFRVSPPASTSMAFLLSLVTLRRGRKMLVYRYHLTTHQNSCSSR
jgi:hypothetical protein